MGAILNNTAYEINVTVSPEACAFGKMKISQLMLLHQQIGEEHIAIFGTSSKSMREVQNLAFIFTKCAILIHRLPQSGEKIRAITWCSELKGVRFTRNYQTFGMSGEILTESRCEVTTINLSTRKIVRPTAINGFDGFLYNNELKNGCDSPKKLNFAENAQYILSRKAVDEDIDFNNHVNNTVYADYALSALPESAKSKSIRAVYINFVNEVVCGETVDLFLSDNCGESAVITGKVNDKIAFISKFEF